jgi:uncharacterized protein involved in response to NO
MIINIESPKKNAPTKRFAFLHLGFRPFFVGASSFAILAMLVWMGRYSFGWPISFGQLAPITWHAHEMIFGYSLAVVAGFLLTAIKNWTGKQTIHGYPLLLLFLLWLLARMMAVFGQWLPLVMLAVIDNVWIVFLTVAVFSPLVKAKQWKNISFAVVLIGLLLGNMVFYLGAFGWLLNGIYYGLYAGLYLILALIFLMGRRVIPFFIERGVGCPVQITNWKWIDSSHLIVFGLFAIADLINSYSYLTAGLAGLLCIIHGVRLVGWYTHGIWKIPLLWSLYLGYFFIVLGFALKMLAIVGGVSVFLAVHAFAFGGIGLITIGMMARVSLGHTARNVFQPPGALFWIFALLLCGALVRVVVPLIDSSWYSVWIMVSQVFWIAAFGWFWYLYFPMLILKRLDGHYG